MADVRLTDLEIIQRYSIAVRGETADRAELVEALRADLAWLEGGGRARRAAPDAGVDELDGKAPAPRRSTKAPAKPAAPRAAVPANRAAKKTTKAAARRGR